MAVIYLAILCICGIGADLIGIGPERAEMSTICTR